MSLSLSALPVLPSRPGQKEGGERSQPEQTGGGGGGEGGGGGGGGGGGRGGGGGGGGGEEEGGGGGEEEGGREGEKYLRQKLTCLVHFLLEYCTSSAGPAEWGMGMRR